jgi:hypothetical protein
MEKEIVYTDKYALILSDEKLTTNEWCLDAHGNINRMPDIAILGLEYGMDEIKKILAHLPLSDAPILEGVPLLPPLPQQRHTHFDTSIVIRDKVYDGYNYQSFTLSDEPSVLLGKYITK